MGPKILFQCVLMATALWALRLGAAEPPPGSDLQSLLDKAEPSSEVMLPQGTWTGPLIITKPLTLRGETGCIISVQSDQPAVRIKTREPIVIESLTVQWRRETSERTPEPQAALVAVDARLVMRRVRFQAGGNHSQSPAAFFALGFSQVRMEKCSFEGFEFPVQFADGAKGEILDCLVWKPGHAGITAGLNSAVTVVGCIVAGSGYHGIRCTGGFLAASNNIVVDNKNRGFYLGNKNASGTIHNNLILGNGTGISGFAQSEVEVAHNIIAQSDYAALDARDSCRLQIHHNMLLDNSRGLVLFPESGRNRNVVGPNLFWGNKTDTENFDPPPEITRQNPGLKDLSTGEFSSNDLKAMKAYGLQNPEVFKELWTKWVQWQQAQKGSGSPGAP